jgi:hypothetical protein
VWTYTLPILPPLALLVGRWLAAHLEGTSGANRSPLFWSRWVFAITALGLTVGAWCLPLEWLPVEVRSQEFLRCLRWLAALLFLLSLIVLASDSLAPWRFTLSTLVGGVVVFYLVVAFTGLPLADRLLKEPSRQAAALIRAEQGDVVLTYMVHELSLNTHLGRRRILHWREGSLSQIELLLNSEQRVFVLVGPDYLPELEGKRLYVRSRYPQFVLGANFPAGPEPSELAHR